MIQKSTIRNKDSPKCHRLHTWIKLQTIAPANIAIILDGVVTINFKVHIVTYDCQCCMHEYHYTLSEACGSN